jgi:hypothetical protein
MKFTPKTEQQIAEDALAPDGVYPFRVMHAEDKTSSAGNPMIEIDLLVFVASSKRELKDYLMEKMAFKLRHFCANVGLLEAYNSGTLSADNCIDKEGYVRLGHDAAKPKTDGSGDMWPPKNTVKDYVGDPSKAKPAPGPTDAQLENKSTGPDEDAPF